MRAIQSEMGTQVDECIDNCLSCYRICEQMISHCVRKGGEHASPEHLGLLGDCAKICQTSADFMMRGSQRHHRTCEVCAEICRECAEDCRRLGDDEQMRTCAEICDACAESCQRMAHGTSRGRM